MATKPLTLLEAQPTGVESGRPVATVVKRSNAAQKGFSLIELIVVVTIIGILAAVAVVNIQTAARKARESALKDDLFKMRSAIDTFYADKQRYPTDLNELVPKYIKKIPKDPVTMNGEWDQVTAEADTEEQPVGSEEQAGPGISDVKSLAPGNALDGTPYSEL